MYITGSLTSGLGFNRTGQLNAQRGLTRAAGAQVGDFGLSRVLETNSTHVSTNSYGTVAYMPAEMLKDGKMTKSVDVYSFAIIMLELFMGDMVFRGMSSSQARAASPHVGSD